MTKTTIPDAYAFLSRRRDHLRERVQGEYAGKDYDLQEIGALNTVLEFIQREGLTP